MKIGLDRMVEELAKRKNVRAEFMLLLLDVFGDRVVRWVGGWLITANRDRRVFLDLLSRPRDDKPGMDYLVFKTNDKTNISNDNSKYKQRYVQIYKLW